MTAGKISISFGPSGSDATSPYTVTYPPDMTVREFIEEWLTKTSEWGYFGISAPNTIFGDPLCEYAYGEIKGKPLPDYALNAKIKQVTGSGGWSRSDFQFTI